MLVNEKNSIGYGRNYGAKVNDVKQKSNLWWEYPLHSNKRKSKYSYFTNYQDVSNLEHVK